MGQFSSRYFLLGSVATVAFAAHSADASTISTFNLSFPKTQISQSNPYFGSPYTSYSSSGSNTVFGLPIKLPKFTGPVSSLSGITITLVTKQSGWMTASNSGSIPVKFHGASWTETIGLGLPGSFTQANASPLSYTTAGTTRIVNQIQNTLASTGVFGGTVNAHASYQTFDAIYNQTFTSTISVSQSDWSLYDGSGNVTFIVSETGEAFLPIPGGAEYGVLGSVSGTLSISYTSTPAVPEPGTLGIFGAGLISAAVIRRRKRAA